MFGISKIWLYLGGGLALLALLGALVLGIKEWGKSDVLLQSERTNVKVVKKALYIEQNARMLPADGIDDRMRGKQYFRNAE